MMQVMSVKKVILECIDEEERHKRKIDRLIGCYKRGT